MFESGTASRDRILAIGAVGKGREMKAVCRRSAALESDETADAGRSVRLSIETGSESC